MGEMFEVTMKRK